MRLIFCLFFLPLALIAQNGAVHKSPERIEVELEDTESLFRKTKKMFNPYYTGPLITPTTEMMPVGQANIQPFMFITGNYANFDEDRHSIPLLHNSYQFKVVVPIQIGVTDSTDVTITPSATANWQNNMSGGGFGDLVTTYGFLIFTETVYIPQFKFTISEQFPTGRYKNLTSLGLNGSGEGSYQTQFGFVTSKIIWWTYPYPINTHLFLGYNIATDVNVSGFNNYGGGFGTKGRVRPGNTSTADFGFELSFSQHWVFACDLAYTAQDRTKFHGIPGRAADGTPADVGSGFNDNLSLAPAIEYNFSDMLSILWGVQFSVYGRNSQNFVNGQFSCEYQW